MAKQQSPFAALSGAEKQIKWLEYQSIRLPYMQADLDTPAPHHEAVSENEPTSKTLPPKQERPQLPPDLSRMANEFQKSHHSQYQAVIARMKQAEMQARRFGSQPAKQG